MTSKSNQMIDVAFGLPSYMQEFWDTERCLFASPTLIDISDNLSYNYGQVRPALKTSILKLHKLVGNAKTDGYSVVVGAGASQTVSALSYAIMKLNKYDLICMQAPFWGRLEFLLNLGANAAGRFGNCLVKKAGRDVSECQIVTRPNNPDFTMIEPNPKFSVVDMCYNWPQYVPKVECGNYDVMVFGLSKATGHAGTRVGWALVKDHKVAEYMKEYIEQSSCGVSEDAQTRAANVISSICTTIETKQNMDCFTFATSQMKQRWGAFSAAIKNVTDFTVLNSNGMFAWCHSAAPAIGTVPLFEGAPYRASEYIADKYQLTVTPGSSLGLDNDLNYFRINLGCSSENFNMMIKALANGNKT